MKLMIKSALFTTLLAMTMVANAGYRYVYQVNIGSNYAFGAIADARGSADGNQRMGCWENTSGASCYASNSAGTARSCYTTDPTMRSLVRSIGSESYIYFTFDTSGNCNYLYVENTSVFKPGAVSGT